MLASTDLANSVYTNMHSIVIRSLGRHFIVHVERPHLHCSWALL